MKTRDDSKHGGMREFWVVLTFFSFFISDFGENLNGFGLKLEPGERTHKQYDRQFI
jgi:hypothetical protein